MDTFLSPLTVRINHNAQPDHSQSLNPIPSSSTPPSPTSSHLSNNSIDLRSDPLQQWLVFSPPSDQLLDPELSPHQQPPLPHLASLPSMPTHDGRGRFENSLIGSIPTPSPPHSDSDLGFSHIHPISLRSASFSDLHSEDDLLSIPSSLSINLSGSTSRSRRSPSPEQVHVSPTYELSAQDSELLRTPLALSAGLAPRPPPSTNQIASTTRSSRRSADGHPRSHSRRARPRRTSSASPCPGTATHPAARSFLANVAAKLIRVDAETLRMVSSATARPMGSAESNPPRTRTRFAVGDGDVPATTATRDGHYAVTAPMDLSAYLPPSWRQLSSGEPHRQHHQPIRASEHDHQSGNNAFESRDRALRSSMAGVVLKKVLDEWTNW